MCVEWEENRQGDAALIIMVRKPAGPEGVPDTHRCIEKDSACHRFLHQLLCSLPPSTHAGLLTATTLPSCAPAQPLSFENNECSER